MNHLLQRLCRELAVLTLAAGLAVITGCSSEQSGALPSDENIGESKQAVTEATAPYPPNGDTNGASPNVVLHWMPGDDVLPSMGNRVFFGTSYTAVLSATTASPEYKGDLTERSYDPPGSLTAGTTYYWRIDTITSGPIYTGTVWSFQVFDGSALPTDFQNGYAVWVADTMTKICTDTTKCTASLADYPDDPRAVLYLARREYEGFQIGIVPSSGRRLDNVRVVTSDLTNGDNTIPVDWKVVGLLQDGSSWVPDVLLPVADFDMQPNYTHSIVVTVKTDPATPVGIYTGTVTLESDSGLDRVIDVEARVGSLALPLGAGNLRTAFTLHTSVIPPDEYRQYGNFMLEYRLNPDDIYRAGPPNASYLQDFKDRGMNSFNVLKIDSNQNSVTVVDNFLNGLSQDLRDMAWLYGYDEKGPELYETLRAKFAAHEAAHPDIERMTTAHIYAPPSGKWADPVGDMAYYNIDWMCPVMDLYDDDIGELLRANGYKQWTYGVRTSVEQPLVAVRSTFWSTYRHKTDGHLHYSMNSWATNEAIDPADGLLISHTPTNAHYDAESLFYGGTMGPLAGLRMYNMRDGIEDWEYLYALAQRIEDMEVALELTEDITWGSDAYVNDPSAFIDRKREIGDWLDQAYLSKDPTPSHRSEDNGTTPDLTWESDSGDVDSFHVYLGTSYANVLNATTQSAEYKGNQVGTTYDPGTLAKSTTYYWRIDEIVDGIAYKGYVWRFFTGYGLCGHWKFDETSGSVAEDSSGRDNDGTITGTASHVDGMVDNGLGFVGDTYAGVPAAALDSLNKQVTVSFWQYGAAAQPQAGYAFMARTSGATNVMYAAVPYSGNIVYWSAGGGDTISKTAKLFEVRNRWNHWAFTKNADTGVMNIYLNGALWHTGTGKTTAMGAVSVFKIGSYSDGTYKYEGIIDDFRVYDKELGPDQIEDIVGQADDVPAKGLVGRWRFNEFSGGTAFDMSDYGNHGTITGASHIDGKVGKAIYFNGTQYVDAPIDGWAAQPSFSKGVTTMMWLKGDTDLLTEQSTIFNIYNALQTSYLDASVIPSTYTLIMRAGSLQQVNYTMTTGELKGEWHHWAFVKNIAGSASYMRILRDGVQVASLDGTGGSTPIDTLVGPIRFGSSKNNPSASHYNGSIDEIRMYNYAVSNADIAAIYQSEAASFVGLIGRWKFNENSGSTAQDDTAFDYDGTITSAAWIGGYEGSALDFEGTDYVTVPSSALAPLDKEATVTMWLYGDPAFQPQANSVIAATDSGGRNVINALAPHSNGIVLWYCGASPYGTDDYTYKQAIPSEYEGQWNHWAFTKNAVTGTMKIYLNGNPTPWHSGTGKYRSITQAASFKIGSAANGTSNYDGMIDDVRVYNTELNGTDIQSVYQGN